MAYTAFCSLILISRSLTTSALLYCFSQNATSACTSTRVPSLKWMMVVPGDGPGVKRRKWYRFTQNWFFCRSEEHTSELQSRFDLVCRLLLEITKIYNSTIFFV